MAGGRTTLGGVVLASLLVVLWGPACGDVIVLKNGSSVEVAEWQDVGDAIEFSRFGGIIRIPKEEVLRIERESSPPPLTEPRSTPPAARPMIATPPTTSRPSGKSPTLLSKPFFKTMPPEARLLLIEGEAHDFTRVLYDPAVAIQSVSRTAAAYDTPEESLIAHISAMVTGDHAWWLAGWSSAAQTLMKAEHQKLKLAPADWQAIWKQGLEGKQVRLVERIDYGRYVLLGYRLEPGPTTSSLYPFVAVNEGNRWVATQDLTASKFFHKIFQGVR